MKNFVLAFVALAALAACSGAHAPAGRHAPASCDRACLQKLIDAVMNAMLTHETARLPLAAGFRYVENNQTLNIGQGSGMTVQAFGPYRHYFADPDSGSAAVIATMRENDEAGLFTLRIRALHGKLTEAEAVFTHDPQGAARYVKLGRPAAQWLETVPEEQRLSREELADTANKYYGAMENNDGKGDYSFFADDCNRLENGLQTTNSSPQRYGHSRDTEFVTLGCRGQFETGFLGFVTRIRDRRHEVIDVERGAVFSIAGFDLDGRTRSIPLTNGGDFILPPYFSASRTLQVGEAFRIREGRIHDIETTLHEFPYGMPTGFNSTYDPSNDVPGGKAPDAAKSCDAACLESAADRLLAAMSTHHPERAPLADSLRYTENDQRLEVYDGLWGTLTEVGPARLRIAEPELGQLSVVARAIESGLPGILALRLRIQGGRITEIEARIVREERSGAEALFRLHPPVEVDPAGVARFDPLFASVLPPARRIQRAQLAELADRYFDAVANGTADELPVATDCSRRENGVQQDQILPRLPIERIRDRRVVVADAERGLVVATAYYDLPGTLATPHAPPATLAVQQVLKVDAGLIQRIETVGMPLPYGATPYWTTR